PTPAAAPAPVAASPLEVLTSIVSSRTGYPPDLLDPDLDMEADLGIDSIKRIEILGSLAEKLGLAAAGAGRSALVEDLAGLKTLRGIATRISSAVAAPPPGDPGVLALQPSGGQPMVSSVTRYILTPEE